MDKKTALEMSYDEWQAILDPDHWEYLDYMKDVRGLDIRNKESCWEDFYQEMESPERELGNYSDRISKTDVWEHYEKQSQEIDDQNSIEEDMYAKFVAQEMQWHHIEPVNDPYWKRCVDKIEKALNSK